MEGIFTDSDRNEKVSNLFANISFSVKLCKLFYNGLEILVWISSFISGIGSESILIQK